MRRSALVLPPPHRQGMEGVACHSSGLVHIPRLGWGLDSTFTHRLVLSGIKQMNAVHLLLGCRAAQERRAAGSDVGGGRTRHAAVWRRCRYAALQFDRICEDDVLTLDRTYCVPCVLGPSPLHRSCLAEQRRLTPPGSHPRRPLQAQSAQLGGAPAGGKT